MRVSSNREKAGKARSYGLYRHLKSYKEIIKNLFRYYYKDIGKTLKKILDLTEKQGVMICDVKTERADLEQRFLELTGEGIS